MKNGCKFLALALLLCSNMGMYAFSYKEFEYQYNNYDSTTVSVYETVYRNFKQREEHPISVLTVPQVAYNEYNYRKRKCTVTEIHKHGLKWYSDITELRLPKTISYIDPEVTLYCHKLQTIRIAAGNPHYKVINGIVYQTSNGHLSLCIIPQAKQISAFTVAANIDNVGIALCGQNNLTRIEAVEGNPHYTAIDGVLYNKAGNILLCYPAGKRADTFIVPKSVDSIAPYAFRYTHLRKLVIDNNVTTLSPNAFSSARIDTLVLGESIAVLEPDALKDSEIKILEILNENISSTKYAIPDSAQVIYKTRLMSADKFNRATDPGYQIRWWLWCQVLLWGVFIWAVQYGLKGRYQKRAPFFAPCHALEEDEKRGLRLVALNVFLAVLLFALLIIPLFFDYRHHTINLHEIGRYRSDFWPFTFMLILVLIPSYMAINALHALRGYTKSFNPDLTAEQAENYIFQVLGDAKLNSEGEWDFPKIYCYIPIKARKAPWYLRLLNFVGELLTIAIIVFAVIILCGYGDEYNNIIRGVFDGGDVCFPVYWLSYKCFDSMSLLFSIIYCVMGTMAISVAMENINGYIVGKHTARLFWLIILFYWCYICFDGLIAQDSIIKSIVMGIVIVICGIPALAKVLSFREYNCPRCRSQNHSVDGVEYGPVKRSVEYNTYKTGSSDEDIYHGVRHKDHYATDKTVKYTQEKKEQCSCLCCGHIYEVRSIINLGSKTKTIGRQTDITDTTIS